MIDTNTSLTFTELRRVNIARCLRWHPGGLEEWSLSEWYTALGGEFGELGGAIKETLRQRDGAAGKGWNDEETQLAIRREIADVAIYLDLLAARAGTTLEGAITEKFNRTSEKLGFPERLSTLDPPAAPQMAGSGDELAAAVNRVRQDIKDSPGANACIRIYDYDAITLCNAAESIPGLRGELTAVRNIAAARSVEAAKESQELLERVQQINGRYNDALNRIIELTADFNRAREAEREALKRIDNQTDTICVMQAELAAAKAPTPAAPSVETCPHLHLDGAPAWKCVECGTLKPMESEPSPALAAAIAAGGATVTDRVDAMLRRVSTVEHCGEDHVALEDVRVLLGRALSLAETKTEGPREWPRNREWVYPKALFERIHAEQVREDTCPVTHTFTDMQAVLLAYEHATGIRLTDTPKE